MADCSIARRGGKSGQERALHCGKRRQVKACVAGNRKGPPGGKGENVRQELTNRIGDNMVVPHCNLQGHVYRHLRAARPLPGGRLH